MAPIALRLTEMLFASEMHQAQFVNEAEFLEKIQGAINGRAVDACVSLARLFEERNGVKVMISLLKRLNNGPPLLGDPNASGGELCQQ